MDDVIERMAEGIRESVALGYSDSVEDYIQAALRAVHDTHRLVPVEPTEEIRQEYPSGPMSDIDWKRIVFTAPDYTETDDDQ